MGISSFKSYSFIKKGVKRVFVGRGGRVGGLSGAKEDWRKFNRKNKLGKSKFILVICTHTHTHMNIKLISKEIFQK